VFLCTNQRHILRLSVYMNRDAAVLCQVKIRHMSQFTAGGALQAIQQKILALYNKPLVAVIDVINLMNVLG
jgi:hypothetical protein